jgi:hypothetical protein
MTTVRNIPAINVRDRPVGDVDPAVRGYVGYFGALSVYPNMVFHQILTGISFAGGTTLKRPLELSGDEVTIKFPPTTNPQGQQTTTLVTLHRLSGETAMIPARDRSR